MSTRDQQCFALGPDCKSSSTCLRRPFTLRDVNIDGNCIRRLGTLLAPTPTNTPSGPSSSPAGSRPRPQAGAFVGIGLGSAAVAVGSTLLCIYLLLRRKRRNTSASLSEGVLPTTASDIAHGDPGGLGTRSIHGDSRRGSEHPSPGPRWSDRGTSGSTGEPCLCLPPWTSDKSAPSGLTSSLEEHAAGGQPDERAAEPNATSRSDGVFADGSETDTVGSLGAPPAYGEHHMSGGGELANGRRGSHGWLEDFDSGSQSEVTVSTLPPPYAEQ